MAKKERKMSLGNNGYQSEKRGSYFQGVVIVLIIAVVATVGLSMLVSALLSGCGSGSDTSAPVYNQNGVCVENCGNGDGAGDGSVYPPGDTCDHEGCGFQPQPDYVAPPCKVPTDPKIKKMCTPQAYKGAYCGKFDGACEGGGIPCFEDDGWTPLYCVSDKRDCRNGYTSMCSNYPISKECESDKECSVPCDAWPPEVCQGLPCQLVGKWQCPSGSVMDFTDMEFYDNGDGYCRMHFPQYPNGDLYNKPGDDHVQRPPSGEPVEEKYTILDNGNQLLGDGSTGTYTCTKVVEE